MGSWKRSGFGVVGSITSAPPDAIGSPARMLAIELPPSGVPRIITGITGGHTFITAVVATNPVHARIALVYGGGATLNTDKENPLPNGVFQTSFPDRTLDEEFGWRSILDTIFDATKGFALTFPRPIIVPPEETVIAMMSRAVDLIAPTSFRTVGLLSLLGYNGQPDDSALRFGNYVAR